MEELEEEASPFEVIAKYQRSIPVEPQAIARDLGINVLYTDLGPEIAGQIVRDHRGGPSGFSIIVNSRDHPNRQRFTLAHEIAHFVLHRQLIDSGIQDTTMYRSHLSDSFESQANRLAADILMPVMKVKEEKKRGANVEDLARRFKVSKAAMQIRFDSIRV